MGGWWVVLVAYMVGSLSLGVVVVRVLKRVDVRSYGSGSTGMTNVLRIAGRGPALLVLAGDAGKGAAMVLLAQAFTTSASIQAAAAAAVVVGHIWPVFAGFRGGRGIATSMGATAVLAPWLVLIGFAVFLPIVGATRYVSLGSVVAVVAIVGGFVVAAAVDVYPAGYLWYPATAGPLIIFMHRSNVQRLLRGTERRLGDSTL